MLYEHDVDGPGIARIRSKGDKVLFGGRDTKTMKEIWGVPGSRPLADFAPEVVVIAKQLAAAITTHNVKTNDLYGEPAITEEHVENNRTVYQGLKSRGIQPQHLKPEEDIQKVARRHAADAKQLAKTDAKKKMKKCP